jgi:hypothetical protein
LPEDGALIAIENVIDDARRENAFGLLMSLNPSHTSNGQQATERESGVAMSSKVRGRYIVDVPDGR